MEIKMSSRHKLYVKKRDGSLVPVRFDEITDRITDLCDIEPKLDDSISPYEITKQVIERLINGITSSEIDEFAAELCATTIEHPDYLVLASRLIISNHHKNLECANGVMFSDVVEALYKNVDQNGSLSPIINQRIYDLVGRYKRELNDIIDLNRDYLFDFFGFKTLQKSYLLKVYNRGNNTRQIVESPQHMFLRVAMTTAGEDEHDEHDFLDRVRETYDLLSNKYYTHASPTLYNAGTRNEQMFSCFIMNMGDSIKDIFKCISDVAQISKFAGGIGISISDIRGYGSYVRGTGGTSDGLVPLLSVLNQTSCYINQGSRRNGSFAVYIEPWHKDIFDVIRAKGHSGTAKELFYGLWIPSKFMESVINDLDWYLMCPSECTGLTEAYGDVFNRLYDEYVVRGMYSRKIRARELWDVIIDSLVETGVPYMCFKDAANEKSNHKNIGTIKSSNLCTEIMEYNSTERYACCCLASIVLQTFVRDDLTFDYEKLIAVARTVTRNLNRLIDINFYPVPETKLSNLSERPLGIGVQGLADTFIKMRIPYDSEQARLVNKRIFECIYYGCIQESIELAKRYGSYKSYENSPMSMGQLQFDMWGVTDPADLYLNWTSVKEDLKKYGIRNSLLTSLMPTASTGQIMGSTECFEPISSNLYARKVLAGQYLVYNRYLIDDLIRLSLFNEKTLQMITKNRGSIQGIPGIPEDIKALYKTCWEIKQMSLITLAIERGPFIDQSQSMNLFFENPEFSKLSAALIYAYKNGLKTGSYYIRSQTASNSEQININYLTTKTENLSTYYPEFEITNTNTTEVCDMCSG